ncbi:Phosphoribosylformylglycinamidine cyclo-ligase protein [Halorhabdus tiamatea SARL4B]|uniref:Phosphoribosylformylglycinamidine cyclo-ligase n=1 Tax=Halorhabdus tiamatea SARL4B TaxID=1033806 RepID=F7PH41_9EURY|nr:phosphoribosylformylglycinamidine cyclo-ligase [Halorhabdus tiamatea]ERJ05654.1 Phosphoribosylformylglycinamidine cyclo-ligase protein [Halorhabdus tiamatea SARL4B]CCQ32459.1 phosphoribosylformylglycinamidine cyclo-ligase [Halorhabdus tiamatea SARL4B]
MTEHDADDDTQSSDTAAESEEGLTYAAAGVDIADSEAATESLLDAAGEFAGDFAGLVDIGDRYLALATDGVGTKLLVAEALEDYSTVGIDCIAMNVNDLIAAGIEPVAFVDYLAIEAPDSETTGQIGEGLQVGAELADIALIGGETAVMPDVIDGLDIAGTAAGLAPKDALFAGEAEVGDAIVGWPSSGIHSNGLTLAREAVTREHAYDDPFPPDPGRTIGEELLTPTRIYAEVLAPLREHGAHAAAHITGGGWNNLTRMGPHRYEIEEPFDAQPVFEFVQTEGAIDDAEMHRTFNMGTGFVATLDPGDAMSVVEATTDGRIVGRVVDSEEAVSIRGLELA